MRKRVLYVVRLLLLCTFVLPLYSAGSADETKTEEETPSYQSVVFWGASTAASFNGTWKANHQSSKLWSDQIGRSALAWSRHSAGGELRTQGSQGLQYLNKGAPEP